jgi:hypothetical protein
MRGPKMAKSNEELADRILTEVGHGAAYSYAQWKEIKANIEEILNEPDPPVASRGKQEVQLNEEQRQALAAFFDNGNPDDVEWPEDEPVTVEVDRGQLVIGGTYLHEDGEWATFHEDDHGQ